MLTTLRLFHTSRFALPTSLAASLRHSSTIATHYTPNMSSNTLSISTSLPLPNSSAKIPQLGFGVYQSPPSTCVNSCLKAFEAGYRHIDTAQYYENEASVGQAVRESKLPREEVYITSKILNPGTDVESTYQKIVESVEKLAGKDGYVDLFLIHSANGGEEARKLMWLALEKAKEEKKVREIGVSNYGIQHIEEIKSIGKVWPPAVNQIELHPWCQQRDAVEYCKKNGIVVEAYCPLVRNKKADDKTLLSICKKHSVGANQVLVRWSLQKGWVPLPKSDNPFRIVNNAEVYGFELDSDDMAKLDGLDEGSKGAIVQAVSNE